MNDKIDVLTVLDAVIVSAERIANSEPVTSCTATVEVARQTRAAIAELIEAADRVWSKGGAVPGSDWDALGNALARITDV